MENYVNLKIIIFSLFPVFTFFLTYFFSYVYKIYLYGQHAVSCEKKAEEDIFIVFNGYIPLIISSIVILLLLHYVSLNLNYTLFSQKTLLFLYKLFIPCFLLCCFEHLVKKYNYPIIFDLLFQLIVGAVSWKLGIKVDQLFGIFLNGIYSFVATLLWFIIFINIFKQLERINNLGFLLGFLISLFVSLVFLIFKLHYDEMVISINFCFIFLSLFLFYPKIKKIVIFNSGSQLVGYYVAFSSLFFTSKTAVFSITFLTLIFCLLFAKFLFIIWWIKKVKLKNFLDLQNFVYCQIEKKVPVEQIRKRIVFNLFGIPISLINMKAALLLIEYYIQTGKECSCVLSINPIKTYMIRKKLWLMDLVSNSFLLIPDGIGIVKALSILYSIDNRRVTGVDLFHNLCMLSQEKKYKLFIFGSKENVNNLAVAKLIDMYPGIVIAGKNSGFVKKSTNEELIKRINDSGADILFVGQGSPRQEEWIYKNKSKLNSAKICIGIGGTLDTIAGNVKRAPVGWQKVGLEWLYRLIKQPARIKVQIYLFVFILEVFVYKIFSLSRKRNES